MEESIAQHTPGPWYVETERTGRRGNEWLMVVTKNGVICRVGTPDMRGASADARLIAAAPELLELAQMIADEYADAADWKDAKATLQQLARAALAKAGAR